MPIPGQENINIGAQNEAANSDSLFTAFNKAQNNFTTLFSESSQYTNFIGNTGIGTNLDSNTKTVTITNTGVTALSAGTGISLNTSNGNVTISVSGSANGALVAGVTNVGITSSTLQILNSPIVSSGTIGINLPILANVTPGTYTNPQLEVDSFGRITSVQNSFTSGTVTSVALNNGPGISVSGGPIVTNGSITVTNTGVRKLNPGPGILLTDTTGEITISANLSTFTGTVSRVTVTSNTLSVSNPTITLAGNINIELPTNLSVVGNFTGGGNFNVGQNISVEGNITANGNLALNHINANSNIVSNGNILTSGIISSSGNILSGGNVSVTGVNRLRVPGGTNGQILQTDGTGNLSWVTPVANVATLGAVGANGQLLFNDAGAVGANANLTFNKTTGVLTATSFSGIYTGAGNNLSNIQGANVSGTVANATYANSANTANLANVANFVSNSTQLSITTLGNLTSLSVVGNIRSNNAIIANGFMYAQTPANTTSNTQVATTAYVNSIVGNLDLSSNVYAPINNPVFTGTPQAPTPPINSPGSNALATTEYVKSVISDSVSNNGEKAGTIKLWTGSGVPDSTWAFCNGQAVNRQNYAALFARIGTTYGVGDGINTFNLPDFRDKFAVGAGNIYSRGDDGGSANAIVVSHTHSVTDPGHPHILRIGQTAGTLTPQIGGWNFVGTYNATAFSNYIQSANTNISINTEGVSGINQNLPPYLATNYIIKLVDDAIIGYTLTQGTGVTLSTTNGVTVISAVKGDTGAQGPQGPIGLSPTNRGTRVYMGTNQSILQSSFTKLNLDVVSFDIDSEWNATNKRFQPSTAGYYVVNAVVGWNASVAPTTAHHLRAYFWKNGAAVTLSQTIINYLGTYVQTSTLVDIIYMNGTTDYLEVYVWQNRTVAQNIVGSNMETYFTAFMSGGDPNGQIGPQGPAGPATGLGYGQTWQAFTVGANNARVAGTTYYNTTDKPIMVSARSETTPSNGQSMVLTVNGIVVDYGYFALSSQQWGYTVTGIVPPGASYIITASATTIAAWVELR